MLDFGSILDSSFKIFKNNFGFFWTISLICGTALAIPYITLIVLLSKYDSHFLFNLLHTNGNFLIIFLSKMQENDSTFVKISIISVLIICYISLATILTILQGIKYIETKEKNKYKCLLTGFNIGKILDSIFIFILLGTFLIAVAIPIVNLFFAMRPDSNILLIIISFFLFMFMIIFGIPMLFNFTFITLVALIFTGKTGLNNFKYIWELTRQHQFMIFWFSFAIGIVINIINTIIMLPLSLMFSLPEPSEINNIITIILSSLDILLVVLLSSFSLIFYSKVHQTLANEKSQLTRQIFKKTS